MFSIGGEIVDYYKGNTKIFPTRIQFRAFFLVTGLPPYRVVPTQCRSISRRSACIENGF